jgi:hypothetical protein
MVSKYRIDLGSSNFRSFIENKNLYIDKTLFIQHIIDNPSQVLLFTRPRRMGKTLNLDTLRTFVDPLETDAKELFKGLAIEKSPVYDKMGSYPVIWLSFKDYTYGSCIADFLFKTIEIAKRYLKEDEFSEALKFALQLDSPLLLKSISLLIENIYKVTGKKSYVIIDEYDKLVMDSAKVSKEAYQEALDFTRKIMLPTFKDNPYLQKGVITGVNRIAQESMFSDLNNIKIDGVFQSFEFDTDFGFTEKEVSNLIKNKDEMLKVRDWYNGYRKGNSKIYFAYSVMGYLDAGKFDTYWGKSGTIDLIKKGLVPDRVAEISKMISGKCLNLPVRDRISGEDLNNFRHIDAFYSLLIQTGYLTYDRVSGEKEWLLYCSNVELKTVWEDFILNQLYNIPEHDIFEAFNFDDIRVFQGRFQNLMANKLSFFDFKDSDSEDIYHAYVLGLLAAAGLDVQSNKESGLGRYDVKLTMQDRIYIFEFKRGSDPEKIEEYAHKAITQIHDKRYYDELNTDKPIILVGIGFCGKANWVSAEAL